MCCFVYELIKAYDEFKSEIEIDTAVNQMPNSIYPKTVLLCTF